MTNLASEVSLLARLLTYIFEDFLLFCKKKKKKLNNFAFWRRNFLSTVLKNDVYSSFCDKKDVNISSKTFKSVL